MYNRSHVKISKSNSMDTLVVFDISQPTPPKAIWLEKTVYAKNRT